MKRLINFILSFLGLRVSGFKRQSRFLVFVINFRNSKYMRHSMTHFVSCIISSMLFIGSVNDYKHIDNLYLKLSRYSLPMKLFVQELVNFPSTVFEYMRQNKNLKAEVQKLRMENDELKIAIANIKISEDEVENIKRSVDLKYSISNYKTIEKVLGFDNGIYESFMLISASHDNTKEGAVVISSDGLVGIVHDVKDGIARVMHICDSRFCVPVVSKSGEHIILAGNGENSMISKEIKKHINTSVDVKVKDGEKLYTSGEGGVFQHGIPVAVVSSVEDCVKGTPVNDLNNVSFVWIIDSVLRAAN
ncbi:MAG: rod shape-determining protein MreC [Holosporales bacterium]|nr:rod shape-determining protein MreC [Holosporales bacterium]